MSILDQLGGLLQQYAGGNTPANEQDALHHFDTVASQAPQSTVANAISAVFRSPQTGTFGQNISQMYAQSNPEQRAGILGQLLSSLGPAALAGLGGMLGGGLLGGTQTQVSPQQAQQVSPAAVEAMANQAEQHDPSIIDRASSFYAQHPTLVKALGAGAAVLAMKHIADSRGM